MNFRNVRPLSPLPLKFLLCVCLAFAGLCAEAAKSKPNILIIVADQWRFDAFGYAGNKDVKTPHLDLLARESVNFQNAIVSVPVCCPTRATLLTGQRALTHGVFLNDAPLSPDAKGLGKVLKNEGYDTAYVGKWHLNGDGRSSFIPRERRQGFDYWKVLECTHDYNNSLYFGDTPEKLKWEGYDAIAQTRDAQSFLRGRAENKKPFLFVLAWGPPHDPYFSAPEKYRALYDAKTLRLRGNVPPELAEETRRKLAGYYAHCSALDDCVGDLLQTLRDTGLEKETIVIFTSDHGDMLGSHGLAKKQKPWDEAIRVPMLFRWPDTLKARTLDAVFNSEDFMPTVLGLARVNLPKTIEGADYSKHMRGGKNPFESAALISCVAPFGEWERSNGGKEFRGIRTERYTYVRDLDGPWLFFDNQTDPLQLANLVGKASNQKLEAKLNGILKHKLRQTRDEFLPGDFYVKKWGYQTDARGTIPYTD
ncbi:MAG: sulfatase [Verrucomicrobiota bacterium]